jgi:hypothetical protein
MPVPRSFENDVQWNLTQSLNRAAANILGKHPGNVEAAVLEAIIAGAWLRKIVIDQFDKPESLISLKAQIFAIEGGEGGAPMIPRH